MKLRNKKTGEIATLTLSSNGEDMIIMGNDMYAHITKLSELKDYEDYEEPKEYWYIDTTEGTVVEHTQEMFELTDKERKEIGNYFGTKEEAEKAVEKLKAVKRLKEAQMGFKDYHYELADDDALITYKLEIKVDGFAYEDLSDDLDLLFGGQE